MQFLYSLTSSYPTLSLYPTKGLVSLLAPTSYNSSPTPNQGPKFGASPNQAYRDSPKYDPVASSCTSPNTSYRCWVAAFVTIESRSLSGAVLGYVPTGYSLFREYYVRILLSLILSAWLDYPLSAKLLMLFNTLVDSSLYMEILLFR